MALDCKHCCRNLRETWREGWLWREEGLGMCACGLEAQCGCNS